jgi:hypothetical protein
MIQKDWDLFTQVDNEKLESLFYEMYPDKYLDTYVMNELEYYGDHYEFSGKLIEEWHRFSEEIIWTNRFFPTSTIDLDLLGELIDCLENKEIKGQSFYRARISDGNCRIELNEMGMPPKEKTKNGRANPVGIPYLYLASTIKTAISEVRPDITDFVTVGEFVNH